MSTLDDLIAHFERFPGIGSRQAKRFVFHLLRQEAGTVHELSQLIASLPTVMSECTSCARYFARTGENTLCNICASPHRDHSQLLVIEQDSDIAPVERSGYEGMYFVLGGTVPLLHQEDGRKVRGPRLKELVKSRLEQGGLTEIILGFAVNPDGENTARYVEALLAPILAGTTAKISHLGRGLSTGSELEYADPETIKNALKNRD